MDQTLTPEHLRRLIRVEPELRRLAFDAFEAAGGIRSAVDEPVADLNRAAKILESKEDVRRFLAKNEWTPREFLETLSAAVKALIAITLQDAGQLKELPSGALGVNIELLRHPPDDLMAPLANWRATYVDPSLRELVD